jgi:hypothetical protein
MKSEIKNNITIQFLSFIFLMAGIGIFYLDSTYSVGFYEGIINGGFILAIILFLTVQVVKLKCYSLLSNGFSIVAILVLVAALFFSMASTLIGIKQASNRDAELHEHKSLIKAEYKSKLNSEIQSNNSYWDDKEKTEREKVEKKYAFNSERDLSDYNAQIQIANAEYNKQKNLVDSSGNPVGPKLLEAERKLSKLKADKLAFISLSEAELQKQFSTISKAYSTQKITKENSIKKEISTNLTEDLNYLIANASLVYGIANNTKLLREVINEFLMSLNVSFITQEQVNSLLGLMLIILLEGGLYMVFKPYSKSLNRLSTVTASELENEAEKKQFEANLNGDLHRSMNNVFDFENQNTKQPPVDKSTNEKDGS